MINLWFCWGYFPMHIFHFWYWSFFEFDLHIDWDVCSFCLYFQLIFFYSQLSIFYCLIQSWNDWYCMKKFLHFFTFHYKIGPWLAIQWVWVWFLDMCHNFKDTCKDYIHMELIGIDNLFNKDNQVSSIFQTVTERLLVRSIFYSLLNWISLNILLLIRHHWWYSLCHISRISF